MSNTQIPSGDSLAVIDATDAEVLAPAGEAATPTIQESEQLEKCQFHLHRLGRRIAARENDLIYLYVEAGYYLLKAHEVHRCLTVRQGSDGRFDPAEQTFGKWLEDTGGGVSRPTAYRWMQGAKNCGLTAESNLTSLAVIKDTKQLQGRTLGDICRKPVDKENKEAETHEVTDEELAAQEEEDRVQRWERLCRELHEHGIEADEWAKLDPDRRAGAHDLFAELAKRIKPSLKKAKPVPALPEIVPPVPKATSTESHPWRVGQRTGQSHWQIKHAPGWGVAHEVGSIETAAAWLRDQNIDLSTVAVLTTSPWPTLAEYLQSATTEPDGDPIYSQEDGERGLWWYGYRNPYGSIIVHTYKGDMQPVIEARKHAKMVTVGPFYCEGGETQAEGHVRQAVAGEKSAFDLQKL